MRNPNLVLGSHVERHRPRGPPVKRWENCARADSQERGLMTLTEAWRFCKDRKTWQDTMDPKPSHSPQLVWTALVKVGQENEICKQVVDWGRYSKLVCF